MKKKINSNNWFSAIEGHFEFLSWFKHYLEYAK